MCLETAGISDSYLDMSVFLNNFEGNWCSYGTHIDTVFEFLQTCIYVFLLIHFLLIPITSTATDAYLDCR